MILPILADEQPVDLAPHGFPGVVAVVRPMDLEDKARWYADVAADDEGFVSSVKAVRRQLLRLEGVSMKAPDGTMVPFDAQNPAHVKSLTSELVRPIFAALIEGATLSETTKGNSVGPSASGAPSGTAL